MIYLFNWIQHGFLFRFYQQQIEQIKQEVKKKLLKLYVIR